MTRREFVTPTVARPVKIVVLADIQTDRVGDYEREVFRRVAEEQPDLLLFAGDYVQVPLAQRSELWADLRPLIRELVDHGLAPDGRAFAVQGNVDGHDWQQMFDGLGVQTVNVRESIGLDLLGISLTCLGWTDRYGPIWRSPARGPTASTSSWAIRRTIALGQIDADLLVAGHTHGGQVRLPWIGPLITHSRAARLGVRPDRTARRRHAAGLPRHRHGARPRPTTPLPLPPGVDGRSSSAAVT